MKKSIMITIPALLILGILISGCVENVGGGTEEFVDDMGDTVMIVENPQRIITLTPGLTEMMFYLGLGDRVVGCDSGSDYPPEVSKIERVHTYLGPDSEKIVSLSPDLILMDKGLDLFNYTYDALSSLNLPVYRIYPRSIDDMLEIMLDLGEIMGVPEAAREKVSLLEARIDAVEVSAASLPKDDAPEILHVNYYSTDSDPWVMTGSTISGDLIRKAGGKCAIDDSSGMAVQISVEVIVDDNPDIILTSQSAAWPTESRDLILSENKFSDLDAVKNGLVRDISGDIVDRGGPRMVEGLEEIHRIILERAGYE
ncbi:MAG: ABC transporter substrate-binding protein [Thermoplasmatota archaeon]